MPHIHKKKKPPHGKETKTTITNLSSRFIDWLVTISYLIFADVNEFLFCQLKKICSDWLFDNTAGERWITYLLLQMLNEKLVTIKIPYCVLILLLIKQKRGVDCFKFLFSSVSVSKMRMKSFCYRIRFFNTLAFT